MRRDTRRGFARLCRRPWDVCWFDTRALRHTGEALHVLEIASDMVDSGARRPALDALAGGLAALTCGALAPAAGAAGKMRSARTGRRR